MINMQKRIIDLIIASYFLLLSNQSQNFPGRPDKLPVLLSNFIQLGLLVTIKVIFLFSGSLLMGVKL
jgi:hypothetical protein